MDDRLASSLQQRLTYLRALSSMLIFRKNRKGILRRTWVLDLVPRLSCPTLFLYGGADQWNPPSRIESLRNRIDECGLRSEFIVYPAAGHSFFDDQGKTYQPEAAADAWSRVLTFLANHGPHPLQNP